MRGRKGVDDVVEIMEDERKCGWKWEKMNEVGDHVKQVGVSKWRSFRVV